MLPARELAVAPARFADVTIVIPAKDEAETVGDVVARCRVRLSDTQNGFRAIRTAVLRELALREDSTTIEQEMIMQTLRRGYRMAEVACHEYARRHGRSHVRPLRAAPRYFWSLVRGLW